MSIDLMRPTSREVHVATSTIPTIRYPRAARRAPRWTKLRLILVGFDALAIALALIITVRLTAFADAHGLVEQALFVLAGTGAGLWAVRAQGLFLARVSAVRAVEIQRVTRAMAVLAVAAIVADRVLGLHLRVGVILVGAALAVAFLLVHRSVYRAWLGVARREGRFSREVVVVGAGAEAGRLVRLFDTHRELGIHVLGVVGDRGQADAHDLGDLWLGEADDAEGIVLRAQAGGVVVSPTDVEPERVNSVVRSMQRAGVHVHLGTGVAGVDARRLRALPLAHEPLLYVEAPHLALAQVVAKRAFDIVVSVLMLVLLSPVIVGIAAVTKMSDRGPVFFRQRRIGRNGVPFDVVKFRSMVVDAEARLASLEAANERQGELFKMTHDPRVTRFGKFLRDSSLDELPQLFNVLKGEMSLVGPRPALPKEVANFSAQLRAREAVRPGITGLWQVEARDNPSFEAYTRLDLFYVENWSLGLDLTIVLGTIEQVLTRFVATVRRDRSH